MLNSYKPEQHDIELFAWFAENMALNLLGVDGSTGATGKISFEFAQNMWEYFQKIDLFVLEPGQLEFFLEVHAADLLVTINCKDLFINKLFTLKESVLQPILEKHGMIYLSMMAETKPELVEQLYETHNMLLKSIFTDCLGKAWSVEGAMEKVAIIHHLSNCALKFILQPLMIEEMLQLLANSEPPHESKESYKHKDDYDGVMAIAGAEADHVL